MYCPHILLQSPYLTCYSLNNYLQIFKTSENLIKGDFF